MTSISAGAATSPGQVRTVNEDSYFLGGSMFLVADGMGGHQGGARASRLVVETLAGVAHRVRGSAEVVEAVTHANEAVLRDAGEAEERQGMGTTLVGLCLTQLSGSPHWIAFNVGDSRLYRLQDGLLQQVSTDHSEVQELIEAGEITSDEASTHPHRNVITRSLGSITCPVVDTWMLPLLGPETFVLCSDGLTNELSDQEISRTVLAADSPQAAADSLVAAADAAGGRDNVTVIVVQTEQRTARPAPHLEAEPTLPHAIGEPL